MFASVKRTSYRSQAASCALTPTSLLNCSFRKHQPEAAQAPSGFRSEGGATMKVAEASSTWDDWDDDGDNDDGDGGGNTQRSRDSDLDSLLAGESKRGAKDEDRS